MSQLPPDTTQLRRVLERVDQLTDELRRERGRNAALKKRVEDLKAQQTADAAPRQEREQPQAC